MRRLGFVAGIAYATTACMSVAVIPAVQQPTPLAPVEAILPVSPADAFDRVTSAFMAEGLQVDQADRASGTVKSLGRMEESVLVGGLAVVTIQTERFYRALIQPQGDGSRVLLSVSTRNHITTNGRTEADPEQPQAECYNPVPRGQEANNRKCLATLAAVRARLEAIREKL